MMAALHENLIMVDFRSPQKEDGYTPIANELLDAMIAYGFSKREWAVMMAVIRKTYGYNKKNDALSGWQIAEMTGLDRSDVSKTITDLEVKNVLIRSSEQGRFSHGQEVKSISINKNYASWSTVGKTPTETVGKTPTVDPQEPLVKHPPTVGKTPTETVGKTPTPPLVKHPTQKTTPKDNKDNSKRKAPRLGKITFENWKQHVKESGEKLISGYEPVWKYAKQVGLPDDWIYIAWLKFSDRYSSDPEYTKKLYSDWRRVFLNAIEGNWFRLWASVDGQFVLTTAGVQADLATREAQ